MARALRVLRGAVARLRDAVQVLSAHLVRVGAGRDLGFGGSRASARRRARARGQSAARLCDARRAAAAVERAAEVGGQGGHACALASVRLRGQETEAPRVRAFTCTSDKQLTSHLTDIGTRKSLRICSVVVISYYSDFTVQSNEHCVLRHTRPLGLKLFLIYSLIKTGMIQLLFVNKAIDEADVAGNKSTVF